MDSAAGVSAWCDDLVSCCFALVFTETGDFISAAAPEIQHNCDEGFKSLGHFVFSPKMRLFAFSGHVIIAHSYHGDCMNIAFAAYFITLLHRRKKQIYSGRKDDVEQIQIH